MEASDAALQTAWMECWSQRAVGCRFSAVIKGWRCGAELMCLQGGVSSERASNGTRVMVARASSIVVDGGMMYCRACFGRVSVNGAAGAIGGGEGLSGGGCPGIEDLLKIVARNIAASVEVSVDSGSCGAVREVQ